MIHKLELVYGKFFKLGKLIIYSKNMLQEFVLDYKTLSTL